MLLPPKISCRTVSPARSRKSICGNQRPIFGPGYSQFYAVNTSTTRGNARRRDYIASQEYDLSSAPSPNQAARLELRDLERALTKLPEEQRSVILLVGLQGMDYAEAAAVVNTPVATVRSRIARGR